MNANSILGASYAYTDQALPENLSELQNDTGFITKTVDNLVNYYLKSETYSKTEIESIVGAISTMHFELVNSLPTKDISTNVIYLVPKSGTQTSNIKDEYINLDGTVQGYEKIGDTKIDLSGYVTTDYLSTELANYTTTSNLAILLSEKQDASDKMTSSDMDEVVDPIPSPAVVKIQYSTQEQIIGFWLNSKPIFQRTIALIAGVAGTDYIQKLADAGVVDEILDYEGYLRLNNARSEVIPSDGSKVSKNEQNEIVFSYTSSESVTVTSGYITIKYTKIGG